MIDPTDPELSLTLARAFDRAWERYYSPGRATIDAELARPALANQLVQMAKDGVVEEGPLAAGGLLYLISLTTDVPDISA